MIGDFNLNCLNCNEDNNKRHFYHEEFKLGFIPLPTSLRGFVKIARQ